MEPAAGGTFVVKAGGVTGQVSVGTGTGTTDDNPLYEINGQTTVAAGSIVKVWPGVEGEWLFQASCSDLAMLDVDVVTNVCPNLDLTGGTAPEEAIVRSITVEHRTLSILGGTLAGDPVCTDDPDTCCTDCTPCGSTMGTGDITFTLSGVTDGSGTGTVCTDCDELNHAYTLVRERFASGVLTCLWQSSLGSASHCFNFGQWSLGPGGAFLTDGAGNILGSGNPDVWTLYHSGVASGTEATSYPVIYELAYDDFDCDGPNVFVKTYDSGHCDNFPATLTLTGPAP